MEKIRREYRFWGRVQGVGFRYHAMYSAQRLGLTGWVRNCSDGTVEAQVQGDRRVIADFIEMLHQGRYIEIEDFSSREIPLESEVGFQIR